MERALPAWSIGAGDRRANRGGASGGSAARPPRRSLSRLPQSSRGVDYDEGTTQINVTLAELGVAHSTAIYAVGHFSLSSRSRKHELVAFWAPFLLVHLGGPDNITAYALEDNKLWLRHLQTLVVQVLGAAYVIYKYVSGSDTYLLLSSVLIFLVGVAKYLERTWALKWGNLDHIRSTLKEPPAAMHHHFHPLGEGLCCHDDDGDEYYVRRAHSLFHVCKHAIVDSWVERNPDNNIVEMLRELRKENNYKGMWALIEMELSLMYDILYTKAAIIHTPSGYCLHLISPLAAAAAMLLFLFSAKDGHSRVDVAVTYTLLAGAFILESGSLMRALGSTWTYASLSNTKWSWLRYAVLCSGRWDRLRQLVKRITRRGGGKRSSRRWSGKIGQYNMLHYVTREDRAYRPLIGRLARVVGYKEWWIRYHYSGTIRISDGLKRWMFKYVRELIRVERSLNAQGVIRKNWGEQALEKEMDLYKYCKEKRILGIEFQECMIIWHLGTDFFLAKSIGANKDDDAAQLVKDIRTLSDYMMFLLVERPYMLPGLAQSTLYRRTCRNLRKIMLEKEITHHSKENVHSKLKELFRRHDQPNFATMKKRDKLAITVYEEKPEYSDDVPRLKQAYRVAKKLLQIEEQKAGSNAVLQLLLDVWIDFLVYASNRCSRESHAKKLSNGGELTTILWLMTNYLHQESYAAKPDDP